MKKICITILTLAIIILSVIGSIGSLSSPNQSYLRIHIRANSNSEVDQEVKYLVKEEIVKSITPLVAEMKSKAIAEEKLRQNLEFISSVATKVLNKNGFNYKAKAKLNNELFPTRVYGSVTLESGYYDALIVELGEAKGDNWWCVIYPPLCFTGSGTDYCYRSKIAEIIKSFFN